MDIGVKTLFSDITVPTKDGIKPLIVRVAGGDKTILFWKRDLSTGRGLLIELAGLSILLVSLLLLQEIASIDDLQIKTAPE